MRKNFYYTQIGKLLTIFSIFLSHCWFSLSESESERAALSWHEFSFLAHHFPRCFNRRWQPGKSRRLYTRKWNEEKKIAFFVNLWKRDEREKLWSGSPIHTRTTWTWADSTRSRSCRSWLGENFTQNFLFFSFTLRHFSDLTRWMTMWSGW